VRFLRLACLRDEHGSAAAEFALLAPVLAIILGGIIEVGSIVQTALIARSAAREGARYAAVYSPVTGSVAASKALAYLTNAVGSRTDVTLPALSDITVSSTVTGTAATVTVPVTVKVSMPVMQDLLGAPFQRTGAATMEVTQ